MNGSWVYESIWTWRNKQWVFEKAAGPRFEFAITLDPCAALNPLGLNPGFFWQPPFRVYSVQRYDPVTRRWPVCATIKNW